MSNLTSVKQEHDEIVLDRVRRLREIKNRCFNLIISEQDLTDLAFVGLHSIFFKSLSTLSFFLLINCCKKFWPLKADVMLENLISHIVLTCILLSIYQMVKDIEI